MAHENSTASLSLPLSVVNKVDVGRLLREAEKIDEFMNQAAIRQPGATLTLPKTTRALSDFAAQNNINLLIADDRKALLEFLKLVREHAPQLHMSFSAEPSPSFVQKLVTYLRENIHPSALLQVGLQPTIGAGFMLRTTNKYYDFSLRTHLKSKHDILVHNIRGLGKQSNTKEHDTGTSEPTQTAPEVTA